MQGDNLLLLAGGLSINADVGINYWLQREME